MTQHTFPTAQKVIITNIDGDLRITGREQQTFEMKSDEEVAKQSQDGDTLLLSDCEGSLELTVPFEAIVNAKNIAGDITIENVRQVELRDVDGDVAVKDASVVRTRGKIEGDATFANCGSLDIESVDGKLTLDSIEEAKAGNVGNDLYVQDGIAALHCGNVGGDCRVQGSENAEVSLDNVGGDLSVNDVGRLQINNVGGDCRVQGNASAEIICGNVGGDFSATNAARVQLGNVGGDCKLRDVQGDVALGHTGGSAELAGIDANLRAGHIGSDLFLQADFPVDSTTHLHVGSDARIVLPENANLSIRATVGGSVRGYSVVSSFNGNIVNLVYGNGASRLELNVGGDLDIRGNQSPRSSSSSSSSSSINSSSSSVSSWDWSDFGRDMERLGHDIATEVSSAFEETGGHRGEARPWRDEERRRREAHKAEERERREGERAQRAQRETERAAHIHVRINDREWRFDQERVNHIVEQARRAAAEGVAGALESVEQALSNLRVQVPSMPSPPAPPATPPPPIEPMRPMEPMRPPMPSAEPMNVNVDMDVDVDVDVDPSAEHSEEQAVQGEQQTPKLNPEQEREAILRMIAEGRISPEEGDMLLEALGG